MFTSVYYVNSYFEPQYFVDQLAAEFADEINFTLVVNRVGEVTVTVQTQLEDTMVVNRQVDITFER